MTGLAWGFLTFLALNIIVTVSQVGKPKRPTTPGVAAGVVAIDFVLAALVVLGGQR